MAQTRKTGVWLALLLLGTGSAASAAGIGKYGIGMGFGMAFPSTSGPAIQYGLQALYRPGPILGFKLYYQGFGVSLDSSSDTVSVSASTSHSFLGTEADYYFAGNGFHAGLKLGTVSTHITATVTQSGSSTANINDSHSNIFVGPTLGYDYPLASVSIGGELHYIMGFGTQPPKALGLLATLKYWF